MFRKRGGDGVLPTTAYTSAPARASFRAPRVSCATAGTWIWLLISLSVVGLGVKLLGTPTDLRHLTCTGLDDLCELVVDTEDDDRVVHTFLGRDLIRAEPIRVRRGRAVNVKHMRRKQVRKLGYAYQLVVRLDDAGGEAKHVMSYGTLGRGRARERVDEIAEYTTKRRSTALDVRESSGVSAVGILLIIYGAFSLIFCLILGQFKEPPPPRKRR
mmetsp:Transcript_21060/g.62861  ORF Transcript_21060/g.62861 Transcript_21060/m.62861 type:complete len:214 (+) Transcript_21060:260-901(+)